MQLLHASNLIGSPKFWLITRSSDVIHPQLRNFGSGYETTAAKKRMQIATYVSLFKITWQDDNIV